MNGPALEGIASAELGLSRAAWGGGGGGGRHKGGWVPLMGAQRPFWKVAQACGAGHVMSPQVAA